MKKHNSILGHCLRWLWAVHIEWSHPSLNNINKATKIKATSTHNSGTPSNKDPLVSPLRLKPVAILVEPL